MESDRDWQHVLASITGAVDEPLLLRIGGRSLPEAALLCAWKAFGADHLVAGSDYPVLLSFETYRQTFHYIRESGLPAEDVDQILYHNAQRLLGLAH